VVRGRSRKTSKDHPALILYYFPFLQSARSQR
jgi:hypothetical protein